MKCNNHHCNNKYAELHIYKIKLKYGTCLACHKWDMCTCWGGCRFRTGSDLRLEISAHSIKIFKWHMQLQ